MSGGEVALPAIAEGLTAAEVAGAIGTGAELGFGGLAMDGALAGSGALELAPFAAEAAGGGLFSSLVPDLGGIGEFIWDGEKLFGMTASQLAQQAALQGGAALLQDYGLQQQQNARDDAYDSYLKASNDIYSAQDSIYKSGLEDAWGDFDSKLSGAKADMMSEYDLTRPSLAPEGGLVGESTPDVVKSDLARRAGETAAYNRSRAEKLADLNSMSSLLRMGADKTTSTNQRVQMMGDAPNKAAQMGLDWGLADANNKGQQYIAGGNLMSGVGNLLMANQITKGNK